MSCDWMVVGLSRIASAGVTGSAPCHSMSVHISHVLMENVVDLRDSERRKKHVNSLAILCLFQVCSYSFAESCHIYRISVGGHYQRVQIQRGIKICGHCSNQSILDEFTLHH